MPSFKIINPYSMETIESMAYEDIAAIQQKCDRLNQGFIEWKKATPSQIKHMCAHIAQRLSQDLEELAILISTDMGKPINEALNEVKKCIECCEFYGKHSETIQNQKKTPNGIREPLGIILGILPWNYPLWQIIRYLIPTLSVGNTALIKPAYNTVRIANQLNNYFNEISPKIVDVCIPTNDNTEKLIQHPLIAGVSFTGSLRAGQRVGSLATHELKPCVLELGGSDPFIIFKDADLELAIDHAIKARFTNTGQVCIAAKRILIHNDIYNDALHLFKNKLQNHFVYGNPINKTTSIGPLARKDIKTNLEAQLENATLTSKQIIFEQESEDQLGHYFPAKVIDAQSCHPANPLLNEEVFGPIAVCDSFESLDSAIEKANQTAFGLGASIWSESTEIITHCTAAIECGTIAINKNVHSNIAVPFGGRKKSGLGIELGIEGAFSFTGFKAIH